MRTIGEINLRVIDSAGGVGFGIVTAAGNIVVQADGSVLLPDGRVFHPHTDAIIPVDLYDELKARSARLEGLEK